MNELTCAIASENNSISILNYLYENGCPWDSKVCENAAMYSNLECLKYAHKNGCPWDSKTCYIAIKYDNIICLKYAHENGCPWDEERMIDYASRNGSLKCLKYLHEDCKLEISHSASVLAMLNNGNLDILI